MAAFLGWAMEHLSYLKPTGQTLKTADGHPIEVLELSIPPEADLNLWAKAFRQNYCLDEEIDELRQGTGLTRAQYLEQLVFPDKSKAPGPSIRSGDFAELLMSDYVEHVLGYWVPRDKYAFKASRDESVKGVDILGFKLSQEAASQDTMLALEAKGQLTNTEYDDRLQTAIVDSSKDYLRRAITLNATKQRLLRTGQKDSAKMISRFQNDSDHPYIFESGAAAVLSEVAYDEARLQGSIVEGHANATNLKLIVIKGRDLMGLAHALYERAANEA